MQRFVDTINWCGLRDLGFIGSKFTWLYQHKDGFQIRERLDRGFATVDWLDKFPLVKLYHRTSFASNHCPISLRLKEKKKFKRYGKKFQFEVMWLKESSCEDIVNSVWEEGAISDSVFPIMQCLDNCRMKLNAWNKNVFSNVGNNLDRLQKYLVVGITKCYG